jgi:hypothetical protein
LRDGACKAVGLATHAFAVAGQKPAGDVQHRVGVEISLTFPELEKGNVLGMAPEPGGLVVERVVPLLERSDPEGNAEAGTLASKRGAGRWLGHEREPIGEGSRIDQKEYILVNYFTKWWHARSGVPADNQFIVSEAEKQCA